MSVPNNSMSYDCLKSVLQHMDPNQRASRASRCSSIKKTDSILPQKIDTIHLEPYSISINDTTYRLGVIQQYPEGTVVPWIVVLRNKKGGAQYAMDKWGFRRDTSKVTPGDFYIPADKPKTEREARRREKKQMKLLAQRL